jgi:hypothetical protein
MSLTNCCSAKMAGTRFFTKHFNQTPKSAVLHFYLNISMKVEVSVLDGPSSSSHQHDYVGRVTSGFTVQLTGRDEECRKIWSAPMMDGEGKIKKYFSINDALADAAQKVMQLREFHV